MLSDGYSERQFTHPEWATAFYEAAAHQKASGSEAIMYGVANHPEILSGLMDRAVEPRVLLIGPDRGLTELPVIKNLINARQGVPIAVDAVDPNPSVGETLVNNLPDLVDPSKVKFRFFDKTIEDFISGEVDTYDLAIAAHSLHYIAFGKSLETRGQRLTEVLGTLQDNTGLLAIIAQADDVSNTVLEFRTSSWDLLSRDTEEPGTDIPHFEIEAATLVDTLKSLKPDKQLFDLASFLAYSWFLDMSAFPENMRSTEGQILPPKAKAILSFLIRQDWDNIPDNAQVEILNHLEAGIEANKRRVISLYNDVDVPPSPRFLRGIDYAIFATETASPLKEKSRLSALVMEAEFGKLFG